MSFGAIAHAELNAEVRAYADKQNRESDRDQIERAHHHETKRRRHQQADSDAEQNRENDTWRFQRHP